MGPPSSYKLCLAEDMVAFPVQLKVAFALPKEWLQAAVDIMCIF